MANYQQLQIEANKIIRGTHFYRYSESSYFAHEIQMIREGIENYLLQTEPELALKITEKIIKADGRIIEHVDDSAANLKNFRQFYITSQDDQKGYTLCSQLSWSHIRLIMHLNTTEEREYYLNETREQSWSWQAEDWIRTVSGSGLMLRRNCLG